MQPRPLLSLLHPAIQGDAHQATRLAHAQWNARLSGLSQGVRAHPSNAQASASFAFAPDVGRLTGGADAGPASSRASTSMPRVLPAATRPAGRAAALV